MRNIVGTITIGRVQEIIDSLGMKVNANNYDSISLVEKEDSYDFCLNGKNDVERREIDADQIPYDFEDYMDNGDAWTLIIEKN